MLFKKWIEPFFTVKNIDQTFEGGSDICIDFYVILIIAFCTLWTKPLINLSISAGGGGRK